MTARTTVFLATTGHHTTLGRGEVRIGEAILAGIRAQELRGWVAWLDGSYHSGRKVTLLKVAAIEGAEEAEWGAAVAAFHAARPCPGKIGYR